jgi:Ulp1 family protease
MLNRYLADEFSELRGNSQTGLPNIRWVPCSPALPQQMTDNDCGVFACMFAAFLAAGRIPDFAVYHELRMMRQRVAVALCLGEI